MASQTSTSLNHKSHHNLHQHVYQTNFPNLEAFKTNVLKGNIQNFIMKMRHYESDIW